MQAGASLGSSGPLLPGVVWIPVRLLPCGAMPRSAADQGAGHRLFNSVEGNRLTKLPCAMNSLARCDLGRSRRGGGGICAERLDGVRIEISKEEARHCFIRVTMFH